MTFFSSRTISGALGCLLCLILALVGGACRSKKYIPPFRTLASGSFSEIDKSGEWVIRSKAEWKNFWESHAVENRKLRPLPSVDWDEEFVVCVTLGARSSGLFSLEIIDAQPDPVSGKLIVSYREVRPPSEDFRLEAEALPYHYIALPKTDLEVVFDKREPRSQTWY